MSPTSVEPRARHDQAGLLSDKVVVITGASTGIGAAAARLFAREGAAVVVGARSEEPLRLLTEELRSAGADASYVAGDVGNPVDAERLVAAAIERHGRLDGAFNNAGIGGAGAPLAQIPEASFDRLVTVNLKGVWLAMRAQIWAMLAAGRGGAIANTSSVGGVRGGANLGAYLATKHGVIGLTRGAAHDYGPLGLRINAVAPGTTDTPIVTAWKQHEPEVAARLNAATPLGRAARPAEIAESAAWLLSDRASYVHGAVLVIDGGMSA
jgi:A-factor type gamma-butyrolactone 1'-reductase (1S-forming)